VDVVPKKGASLKTELEPSLYSILVDGPVGLPAGRLVCWTLARGFGLGFVDG
jgi:hypothetical protein